MEEKDIIITTGDLKEDYEILDVIGMVEEIRLNLSFSKSREKIIEGLNIAKQDLKHQCKELDGDAIINCQIKYYGYGACDLYVSVSGTAVKIKSKN